MNNYLDAVLKSLFIVTFKFFVMPLKVIKSAKKSILNSKKDEQSTNFVILLWIKNIYDACIVLSYPIGIFMGMYYCFSTGKNSPNTLIALFSMIYFSPVFLGFWREIVAYFLVSVIKLEEISKNTRRNT